MCECCRIVNPPLGASLNLGFSPSPLYSKTRIRGQGAECAKGRVTCLPPRWREPSVVQCRALEGLGGCVQWERGKVRDGTSSRDGPFPRRCPSLAPPSRVTVRYQPPRVVSLNGHFWMWSGRSRSPEPLGSHWPFPELQGRPQGLSYSPGFHRSPCNKGLRPRQCINKGALSGKQGSETLAVGENRSRRERGGCSCMCRLLSS